MPDCFAGITGPLIFLDHQVLYPAFGIMCSDPKEPVCPDLHHADPYHMAREGGASL